MKTSPQTMKKEEDADNGHNSLQSRLIHVLQEAAARIATASFQGIGLSGTSQLGSIRGREIH
jgi:hypothetical protein